MRTLPCAVNSWRDSLRNYPRVAVDRAGQMLREMEKAKPSGSNPHQDRSHDATDPKPLSGFGISKTQSPRWQKLAAIPEADFEATFE
jgi:hypothetical protein